MYFGKHLFGGHLQLKGINLFQQLELLLEWLAYNLSSLHHPWYCESYENEVNDHLFKKLLIV